MDEAVDESTGTGGDDDVDTDARPGAVMLVAVVDETWEAVLHDGFYPCPSSYPRAEAPAERLALYRTAPESAITHHARIVDRTEERVGPGADLAGAGDPERPPDRLARLVGDLAARSASDRGRPP